MIGAVVLSLAACTGQTAVSVHAGDGGPGDGAGTDAAHFDGPIPPTSGTGSVVTGTSSHRLDGKDVTGSGADARFTGDPQPLRSRECMPPESFGACQLVRCTSFPVDCVVPGCNQPQLADAGPITIKGRQDAFTLQVRSDGQYMWADKSTAAFAEGETVTVAAAGNVVPPFSTTLVTPARVTITSPVATVSGGTVNVTADRTRDLTLQWTGGAAGEVGVSLEALAHAVSGVRPQGETRLEMTCTYPASAGTGTIPSTALAAFSDVIDSSLWIKASVTSAKTLMVGGWSIAVSANADVVRGDGTLFYAALALQ